METANTAPRREDSGELTVGQVAGLVGVSVRTLHHWDEIGLVVPSARSWAGYRLYGPDDVARIHRVLVYRETGMPLAEVARILDDPDVDATAHRRARRRDEPREIGVADGKNGAHRRRRIRMGGSQERQIDAYRRLHNAFAPAGARTRR